MLKEFKAFAMKGNVMDMAVGIIIGAAFGKIVSSLVADVIMPPIGLLMGKVNFEDKFVHLTDSNIETLAAAKEAGVATLNYGAFANTIVNFLIVALAVFLLVKALNSAKKKEEEAPKTPPRQEVLLTEIRDLLAKQQ